MYALVEIAGKQYKAEKGKVLTVDRLEKNTGDKVEFESVLLLSNKGKVDVGTPYCTGALIKATVEEHGKGKKIIVYKYKKRKDYRRKRGSRPYYTTIKIDEIVASGN